MNAANLLSPINHKISVGSVSSAKSSENFLSPVKEFVGKWMVKIALTSSTSGSHHRQATNTSNNNALMSEPDFPDYEEYTTSPLVKALASYDVSISQVLDAVKYDYDSRTKNYVSAKLISDYLADDYERVDMGYVEWLLSYGASRDGKKDLYRHLEQMKAVIARLEAKGYGDVSVSKALTMIWNWAKKQDTSADRFVRSLVKGESCSSEDSKKQVDSRGLRKANDVSVMLAGGIVLTTFAGAAATESANTTASTPEADNATSSVSPETTTGFPCMNGTHISRSQVCDKRIDCADGEDELSSACKQHCEGSDRYLCRDKTDCIPSHLMCDGDFDCRDGSDESRPPCDCLSGYIRCNDESKCIEKEQLCDGSEDCDDGSDEWFDACANAFNETLASGLKDGRFDAKHVIKSCCEHKETLSTVKIEKHHGIHGITCANVSNLNGRSKNCQDNCRDQDPDFIVPWCESVRSTRYPGGHCLEKRDLCDNQQDCANDQDEVTDLCYLKCNWYEVPCGDGNCISERALCNGYTGRYSGCVNERDENPYVCTSERIRIDRHRKCNNQEQIREKDCWDVLTKVCCRMGQDALKTEETSTPFTPFINTSLSNNTGDHANQISTGSASVATMITLPGILVGFGIFVAVFGGICGGIALWRYGKGKPVLSLQHTSSRGAHSPEESIGFSHLRSDDVEGRDNPAMDDVSL